jgi:glycosyltransferase involved in cell wall biosynthesis
MKNPPTIALATHYWTRGCALALKAYLEPRTEDLLFMGHPLFISEQPATFERFVDGKLVDSGERPGSHGTFRYLKELWWTIHVIRKSRRRYQTFVAGDILLAIAGLWLRRVGAVASVVLYTVDYVPRRFNNVLVNRLYHALDRFVVRKVDLVWNVTDEIRRARRQRDGERRTAPQIVVPVGANYGSIQRRKSTSASDHRLVFLGHLLEKQGVQLAIQALPIIQQKIPDISLLIIGDGPFRLMLEDLASRLNLAKSVKFTGALHNDTEIEDRIAASTIGLALFTHDPDNFSQFADPGKIKTYLACGIPVVLTEVPPIARLIEREGAGRIVTYTVDSVAATILDYVEHPESLNRARSAASQLGANFSWDKIFDDAWERTADRLPPFLAAQSRSRSD